MRRAAIVAGLAAGAWSAAPSIATGEHGIAVVTIPVLVAAVVTTLANRAMPWIAGRPAQYRPQVPDAGVSLFRDPVDERYADTQHHLYPQERAA